MTARCDIRYVGGFEEDGSLRDWWFDGRGDPDTIGTVMDFTGRTDRVGGWALEELRWLSERLPEGSKVLVNAS